MDASIPRLVPIATWWLLTKHSGRTVAAGGTDAELVETEGTVPEGATAKAEK